MGADQNLDWNRLAASALDWWSDAGVDTLVEDAPRDWLAPPEPVAPIPAAHAIAQPASAATWPDSIAPFLAWRAGPDAPEAAWPGVRVATSGPADAPLMILVDCPEREDHAMLMEGAVGRLFDRMLAAIGQSRETVHLAPVAHVRPIAGRMPRDVADRLSTLARDHVGLSAPGRLLVMGDAASRAILAMDVREARGRLQPLNHKNGTRTEVVATYHPRLLLERPALKAEAWGDLQLLIGGLA